MDVAPQPYVELLALVGSGPAAAAWGAWGCQQGQTMTLFLIRNHTGDFFFLCP